LVEDSAVLLPAADLVITVMGTATLEAAVADCLPVCAYRGTVAQWLQWRLIGVGTQLYAMPNILLREKIVPELVQRQVTPERLGQEALALWQDPARQAELHAALGRVRQGLGTPGASRRVAEMALRMARGETLSLDEDFSTRRAEADLPS
jgi:lipid-A-disaccharide synthase